MSVATPFTARRATSMRVSPFGSFAFMLPDESRMSSTERLAVLQVWANAREGNKDASTTGSVLVK
jgi:hypothetical protein